ncbi:hypothetical protein ACTXT7_013005 [Hymenolepis weldensis]
MKDKVYAEEHFGDDEDEEHVKTENWNHIEKFEAEGVIRMRVESSSMRMNPKKFRKNVPKSCMLLKEKMRDWTQKSRIGNSLKKNALNMRRNMLKILMRKPISPLTWKMQIMNTAKDSTNGLDDEYINNIEENEDLNGVECNCKIVATNECYVSGYDKISQFDGVTRCNEHLDEGNINRADEFIKEYDEENIQNADYKEYEEQEYLKQPEDENESKCFEGVENEYPENEKFEYEEQPGEEEYEKKDAEDKFLKVSANEEIFDEGNIHDESDYENQDPEEIQDSDNEQCDEEYVGIEEQEDEINEQTPVAYNRNNDKKQEHACENLQTFAENDEILGSDPQLDYREEQEECQLEEVSEGQPDAEFGPQKSSSDIESLLMLAREVYRKFSKPLESTWL